MICRRRLARTPLATTVCPLAAGGCLERLTLSPGEAHDVRLAEKLLSRLKSGSMLLADRGHDVDRIRELAIKKGAWANIPPKSNRSAPGNLAPRRVRAREARHQQICRRRAPSKSACYRSAWAPAAGRALRPRALPSVSAPPRMPRQPL